MRSQQEIIILKVVVVVKDQYKNALSNRLIYQSCGTNKQKYWMDYYNERFLGEKWVDHIEYKTR